MTDEEFKTAATEEIKRLGVFDGWRFMETPARREYRKFFDARTRDIAKVIAVIDEAVQMETMPTVAALSQVWQRLFVPISTEPEISEEEKQKRTEFISGWHAREMEEAAQRRAEFLARRDQKPRPITDADIDAIMQHQNQRRVAS